MDFPMVIPRMMRHLPVLFIRSLPLFRLWKVLKDPFSHPLPGSSPTHMAISPGSEPHQENLARTRCSSTIMMRTAPVPRTFSGRLHYQLPAPPRCISISTLPTNHMEPRACTGILYRSLYPAIAAPPTKPYIKNGGRHWPPQEVRLLPILYRHHRTGDQNPYPYPVLCFQAASSWWCFAIPAVSEIIFSLTISISRNRPSVT